MTRNKKVTLDDIVGRSEKVVFPVEHMEEFAKKLQEKFGEFSYRGLNRFFQRANIAKVAWAMKKVDGSSEKLPLGKVVSVFQYEGTKGKKIWKDYIQETDFPYEFWQELYSQASRYFAKGEYAEQKKLEGMEEMAQGIGQEVHDVEFEEHE